MTVDEYYRQPAVRARIAEYCGLSDDQEASCHYLVVLRETLEPLSARFPPVHLPSELPRLFGLGSDIFRSIWDRRGAIANLDMEYVNFDYRGEPFVHPEAAFRKMEPAFSAALALADELHLDLLSVLTGQGYHFTFRLRAEAPPTRDIASLGRLQPTLQARYESGMTATGECVPARDGRLYAGLGLLMEWFTHLLRARADAHLPIPLTCFGMEVGNRGPVGREALSLDLSAYADPLDRRYTRCACSTYQKPRALASSIGPGIAEGTPPMGCVLRGAGDPLEDALAARRDLARAAARAETNTALLPEGSGGAVRLLDSYRASRLARFHDWYYAAEPDPPQRWPEGYDRLDLSSLPPCVSRPLSRPNDLLLKPTNLQNLARVLWATGWHPRHVGGLLRSKYERDYGWGMLWINYDAATRADVYLRVLAGLVADGTDDLRDFNCISHQEKGYCPQPFCGHSLGDFAVALRSVIP